MVYVPPCDVDGGADEIGAGESKEWGLLGEDGSDWCHVPSSKG